MTTLTSSLILSMIDRVTGPARAAARSVAGLRAAAANNARQMQAMQGQMLGAVGAAVAMSAAIRAPVRAAMEFESAMADVRKVVDFETPDGFRKMSDDILAMTRVIPMAATEISSIVASAGQAGMQGNELLRFAEMAAKVGVAFDIPANRVGDSLAKIKTALGLTVADVGLLSDAINHLSNTSASSAPDLLNFMERVGSVGKQYGFTAEQTAALGSAMIAAGAPAEVAATSFRNVGRALARGASATKSQRKAFSLLGLDSKRVAKSLNRDAVGTLKDVIERIRSLPEHVRASTISDLFGDEARAIMPLIENVELLDGALSSVADQTAYAGSAEREFEVRARTTANALQLLQNQVKEAAVRIGTALLPSIESSAKATAPVLTAIAEWVKVNPRLTAQIIGLVSGLVGLRIATLGARWAFLFLKGGVLDVAIAGARGASGMVGLFSVLKTGSTATRAAALQAAALARAQVDATAKGYAMARSALAMSRAGKLAGTSAADAAKGVRSAGLAAGAAQQNLLKANMALAALGKGGAVSGLLATLGPVGPALAGIGAAVAAVSAPMWLLAGAAVAVGLAIYNYWTPISEFVTGFASVVGSALGEAISAIAGFGSRIATAIGGWAAEKIVDIGGMLGIDEATMRAGMDVAVGIISSTGQRIIDTIKAIPAAVAGWIGDLFSMNEYSDQATAEFRSAGERAGEALVNAVKNAIAALGSIASEMASVGRQLMDMLLEGIKAGAAAVIDYVKTIGSRIKSSITGAASGALSRIKNAVGLGGGPSPANDNVAIAGTRAAGGAIAGGRTYLVGEEGPELVTPSRSGYVHDAETTAAMRAGGQGVAAGAGNQSVHMGGVTIQVIAQPGMDPQAIAHAVNEALGQIAGDALSGGQFDQEWSVA